MAGVIFASVNQVRFWDESTSSYSKNGDGQMSASDSDISSAQDIMRSRCGADFIASSITNSPAMTFLTTPNPMGASRFEDGVSNQLHRSTHLNRGFN